MISPRVIDFGVGDRIHLCMQEWVQRGHVDTCVPLRRVCIQHSITLESINKHHIQPQMESTNTILVVLSDL